MTSDAHDLEVVLKAQSIRDLAPNVSSQVISEMKSSLIFQCNWEELLQSAPTAMSSMGACFVASSSPKASVTLKAPAKGFRYLRFSTIQANLIECGDLGRYAFLEAENGMGIVQLTSRINDILACLSDPVSAKKLLRPHLDTLKNGGQKCLDSVTSMDKKFDEWLLYVCEMHAACVEQESDTRSAALNNEMCLAAESTRLDYSKSSVEEARKTSELLGKQVGTASEAFKKASDEFPTGWDILGQQIVGDLAGAVTSALNAAIPALIDNLNPMSKAKAGADLVGGFLNPKKGETHGTATSNNTNTAASQQSAPPNAAKQLSDPAYAEILKVNTYLTILQVIIGGKDTDGDIDWEKATGADNNAKGSLQYLSNMLGDAKMRFAPIATSAEPSEKLITILDVCTQVSSELQKVVQASSNMSHSWPAKDSTDVKRWQSDFAAQYRQANTLIATAKSIPGGSALGIPLMADPAVQTAHINAKTAQAQAVLESAKNRLSTTTQMLTTAQENYVKTTGMLLEQQNKLGDIQATLTRLTATNVSLKEIKSILVECIKLIIQLKQQITNLLRFFRAITAIVDVCVKFYVEPFLETIKLLVAQDGTDPYKDLRIGNFTLTDLQRSQVYSAALTMRSYFSVFGDIAKMWVELSKDNVLPGLRLCDELSLTSSGDPGQLNKKIADLDKWSKDSTKRVADIARQKQREIMDGMESRIAENKETTNQIAAPPPATLQAITAGTQLVKQLTQNQIQERQQASPLDSSRYQVPDTL